MNGVIIVNKEKNYTSRDVVNIISKEFNQKKCGHFGTLDPLATGVLVIGLGSYTKIGNFFNDDTKEYKCSVLLGKSTDTYDITGNTVKETSDKIDEEKIKKALYTFEKTYMQEVPIYSSVKVNGKKLYEYARNNEKVTLPKKKVTIYSIKYLGLKDNIFTFSCKVSKGTYIRSIVNDLSKLLNFPMCMSDLCRTKQDKFSIKDANTLEEIKNKNYKIYEIEDILDVVKLEIPCELEKRIINGSLIEMKSKKNILFTKNNQNIVLYGKYDENHMKPLLFF